MGEDVAKLKRVRGRLHLTIQENLDNRLNRAHFMALAARVMQQVLVNYAEAHRL